MDSRWYFNCTKHNEGKIGSTLACPNRWLQTVLYLGALGVGIYVPCGGLATVTAWSFSAKPARRAPENPRSFSSGEKSDQDFKSRCAASGVVRCFGFDDWAITDPHVRPPWGLKQKRAIIDTSVKASGAGSLRFEIPPYSGPDTSGNFSIDFSDDSATQFGSGEEFYVQWRQRFSPELLNTVYAEANGWKQALIGEGDRPGALADSCTQLELVVQNTYQRGFPQMYHSCGQKDGNYEPLQSWNKALNDIMLQQGDVACRYEDQKSSSCVRYVPAEWMTFQIHVKIGTWYQNDRVYHHDSSVQLWVARQGQPSKLVIDFRPGSPQGGYDLANNNPSRAKYGKIWLLPYNTNKSPLQSHPTAYTWYDELIISRVKIADPVN